MPWVVCLGIETLHKWVGAVQAVVPGGKAARRRGPLSNGPWEGIRHKNSSHC